MVDVSTTDISTAYINTVYQRRLYMQYDAPFISATLILAPLI
jgi:hypothetical protein